jgi:flagellar basal-body rod modification protein FlgD
MQVSATTPILGSGATAANTATSAAKSKTATLGQNDFLKLLAKQFQTQDPMKPMEDTAFIAQMAQFTSLEQSSSMASQLTMMNAKQDIATANSYLGRLVTVSDGKGGTTVGEATGVEVADGVPRLVVGDLTYSLSSVIRVAPKPLVAGAAAPLTLF